MEIVDSYRYLGVEIHIVRDYMTSIPVKLPKRKKRRLRKKFIKRYGYKLVPKPTVEDGMVLGRVPGPLYMNQRTFNLFRLAMEENDSRDSLVGRL